MKWIHTSDLHIGKQINEFSLLEDQRFFLRQLSELALKERPDVLLISGDLYDRSVPSAEAVSVLDAFLSHVTLELKIPVLAIAGNHDSPQRLDFCSRLLRTSGLYLSGRYKRHWDKITLQDEFGRLIFICVLIWNQRWFVQIFLTRKSTLLMMRSAPFYRKTCFKSISHSGMSSWLTVFFLI